MFKEELEHMEWYERIQIELNQLNERIEKLERLVFFPSEEDLKSLGQDQFSLIELQFRVMLQYRDILQQRLSMRGMNE